MALIQSHNYFDITQLIEKKDILIHFQPIVSIIKKNLVGYESLARGFIDHSPDLIPPNLLFDLASENNLTVRLDRLCRDKSLHAFSALLSNNMDILLFLNIDASILDQVVGSKHLLNQIYCRNLKPSNIVIEINETKIEDFQCLQYFIDIYRDAGFLIALDDIGSGFSNLDRIYLTQPDIIKIDKGIIKDIDKHYSKQEIFKSLVSLSRNTGSLVVAEGIETEEEALIALELGADLLQGYYFSRPVNSTVMLSQPIHEKIIDISSRFKDHITKKNHQERLTRENYNLLIRNVCSKLSLISVFEMHHELQAITRQYVHLECIYILDRHGIQVTDTICNEKMKVRNHKIFHPANKGENHTLKKYYYSLVNQHQDQYMTEPYISLATGNLCTTISALFYDSLGRELIACLDFDYSSS